MSKLTTAEFNTRKPGKYADGDNLHLIVSANGQRRFIYSPRVNGRRPEYGFTPEKALANFPKEGPLKAARLERDRLKGLLAQGIDPRTEKPLNAPDSGLAFKQVVLRFIKEQLTAYKPHTIAAWEYALTVNCKSIADKPLDDITVNDIKALLLPIFAISPRKATDVKRKIAAIFDYAADHELCDRDRRSPAEGKMLLPKIKSVKKHHAALAYQDMPGLIAKLRADEYGSSTVIEFICLTVVRSGEARLAKWSEFNLDTATWAIPAERMGKTKIAHTIPLAPRAMEILLERKAASLCKDGKEPSENDYVFISMRGGPFTDISLLRALKTRIQKDITIHGMRSSFRDWAGDTTEYPRELAEHALAHQVGNAVELSYRRGNALEKRRAMMNDWAKYIEPTNNVIRLQRA